MKNIEKDLKEIAEELRVFLQAYKDRILQKVTRKDYKFLGTVSTTAEQEKGFGLDARMLITLENEYHDELDYYAGVRMFSHYKTTNSLHGEVMVYSEEGKPIIWLLYRANLQGYFLRPERDVSIIVEDEQDIMVELLEAKERFKLLCLETEDEMVAGIDNMEIIDEYVYKDRINREFW